MILIVINSTLDALAAIIVLVTITISLCSHHSRYLCCHGRLSPKLNLIKKFPSKSRRRFSCFSNENFPEDIHNANQTPKSTTDLSKGCPSLLSLLWLLLLPLSLTIVRVPFFSQGQAERHECFSDWLVICRLASHQNLLQPGINK